MVDRKKETQERSENDPMLGKADEEARSQGRLTGSDIPKKSDNPLVQRGADRIEAEGDISYEGLTEEEKARQLYEARYRAASALQKAPGATPEAELEEPDPEAPPATQSRLPQSSPQSQQSQPQSKPKSPA